MFPSTPRKRKAPKETPPIESNKISKTGDDTSPPALLSNKVWESWDAKKKEKGRKPKIVIPDSDDTDDDSLYDDEKKPPQIIVGDIIEYHQPMFTHPDERNIRVGQVAEIVLTKGPIYDGEASIETKLHISHIGVVQDLWWVQILARKDCVCRIYR